jgi:hypothetical protein
MLQDPKAVTSPDSPTTPPPRVTEVIDKLFNTILVDDGAVLEEAKSGPSKEIGTTPTQSINNRPTTRRKMSNL